MSISSYRTSVWPSRCRYRVSSVAVVEAEEQRQGLPVAPDLELCNPQFFPISVAESVLGHPTDLKRYYARCATVNDRCIEGVCQVN